MKRVMLLLRNVHETKLNIDECRNRKTCIGNRTVKSKGWIDRALRIGTGVVGLRHAVTARNDPSGTVSMVPFVGINAPLASSQQLHFHLAAAATAVAIAAAPVAAATAG